MVFVKKSIPTVAYRARVNNPNQPLASSTYLLLVIERILRKAEYYGSLAHRHVAQEDDLVLQEHLRVATHF